VRQLARHPKYWTSVLVQNIFLSCNWLQLAASLCNWLQVSVRVGVACDSRLRRVSRVGFTSIRVVVIGISIALVILHMTYSNISLKKVNGVTQSALPTLSPGGLIVESSRLWIAIRRCPCSVSNADWNVRKKRTLDMGCPCPDHPSRVNPDSTGND
jgi:hypothetical protein